MALSEGLRGNRLGGEDRTAIGGATFTLRQGSAPFESFGAWPRSDEPDVALALELARAGAEQWGTWSPDERRRGLELALDELERRARGDDGLGRFLGLERGEREPWLRAGLARLHQTLARGTQEPRPPGIAIVAPRWTTFLTGIGNLLVPQLLAGRPVVCFADRRFPLAADLWVRVLDECGLPPGLVGLLHGAGPSAHEAAALAPDTVALVAEGTSDELALWRRLARERGDGLELDLELATNSEYVVSAGRDPADEARTVVRRAFGRATTLSGQLPGHVGRVLCPQRAFSAFTEELLAELERSPDVAEPLALIDEDAVAGVRGLRELGLDEGATLIRGGEPDRPLRRSEGRVVEPTVFTNVEPDSRLARSHDPAPVLSLIRVHRAREGGGDDEVAAGGARGA